MADSTSSAASTPSSSSSPSFPFSQPHQIITVKLDRSNFLLWHAQFLPFLQGYDLEGYVDGSNPCPPQKLNNGSPNPAHSTWRKQDKILLGWLMSSLTDYVLSTVVRYSTSADVWADLNRSFASKSEVHLLHMKKELQNIKKGSRSMQDYITHAKMLADSLAASDCEVTDCELQHSILSATFGDPKYIVFTSTSCKCHTSK
ncbi:hypothetical protein BVC80_8993g8 [Macleaya cordata]|uniref:Uncharacterized protein n=1 Tax=Macleaya cordata TaxID=56857 RepID=A0A200R008_MACCD|nr:hypothetical protein BVC80_8993g8 [Macleaya cordata]